MIVSNIKDVCWTLSRNTKTLGRSLYLKTLPDTTTSKWRRRFLSTAHMVLLVTIGFVILICWLPLQLLHLANCLFVGLRKVSTFILTKSWKRRTWITLLLRIRTVYTLHLTNWLLACSKREQTLTLSSTSWTRLQKRSWNLLLINLIKHLPK